MPVDATTNVLSGIGMLSIAVVCGWWIPKIAFYFVDKSSEIKEMKKEIESLRKMIEIIRDFRGR